MTLEQQMEQLLLERAQLAKEIRQLRAMIPQQAQQPGGSSVSHQQDVQVDQYRKQLIQKRIQIFKNLFKGREDIYAVRYESKNGKKGYTPACAHDWQKPICQKPAITCAKCQQRRFLPLTDQVLYDHLSGKRVIGLYPLLLDNTCSFLALDFDKKNWQIDILAFVRMCKEFHVPVSIERSQSGNGGHVWIFFNEPLPAALARKLGHAILARIFPTQHEMNKNSFDRQFPNQDTLTKAGFGNLIALPLQRKARNDGNSVFVDENFIPYPKQWAYLETIKKMNKEDVERAIHASSFIEEKTILQVEKMMPQENLVALPLKIIEKNGLYIEKGALNAEDQKKLVQVASFKNQEYYKAQAKRLSTYGIPKTISCYDETDRYFILPRGCKNSLIALLRELSIKYEWLNQTNNGKEIVSTFNANLLPAQELAFQQMVEQENGVLSATTGFGKTVIAAAMIAKRNVNTLILVHRKQLLDQWKDRLNTFLTLEDGLIGQIGGGKDKPFGMIDIATIQSLNYQGTVKEAIAKYGQIIVDECHHCSAYSFEQVLKKAEARYVYGLTATPTRRDGLHPIMTMQLGPIRYRVTAKSQLASRPFQHLLIPRKTAFKSLMQDDTPIQVLFDELVHNEGRNQAIFNDVLNELENGAVPLILTERVEHVHDLADRFKGFVKNVITLTGGMTKKEEKEKMKALFELDEQEEKLIIATGKYIGEGFDYARLDTLFLVMPLSWKGTLEQYVGRLHRYHEQKTAVKVFDYVDYKEPRLQTMFEKRLKGYQSLGYQVKDETNKASIKTLQMELF